LKKYAVSKNKVKKNAISTPKIVNNAVNGAKVDESTLDTVPTAQHADTLAAPENWHEVGAPGEPGFSNGWHQHSTQPRSTRNRRLL
jgi:hypothetical protein